MGLIHAVWFLAQVISRGGVGAGATAAAYPAVFADAALALEQVGVAQFLEKWRV